MDGYHLLYYLLNFAQNITLLLKFKNLLLLTRQRMMSRIGIRMTVKITLALNLHLTH
jgi:hypothetical protein